MAEEHDEETAQIVSQKRIQQAHDEGNIPMGKESVALASLAFGCFTLLAVAKPLQDALVDLARVTSRSLAAAPFGDLTQYLLRPSLYALAVPAAAGAGGLIATVVQTKGETWFDKVAPDFSRLFNFSKLSQIFSKEFLTDLGLGLLKASAISFVAYTSLRGEMLTLDRFFQTGPDAQLAGAFKIIWRVAVRVLTLLAIFAGLDLALTHKRFQKKVKVTRDEAKREARDDDGDPLIRGRRKKKHRDLLKGLVKVEVPRADALLVNPTHVAVALRYRKDEGDAPRVTAKGKGKQAEIMRELARENGIPIVQDIPLARLLYKKVKVGRRIPAETYKAVAAILAFVYRVTGRSPQRGASR